VSYNGGINRHTAHTCVRRQRSGEPRVDNFWRAKQASRRQTFGERSEFWEKKFDEPSEPLAVFFFFKLWGNSSSEMSPPPPSRLGGWGISPCPVKTQSEMPKNFVCNSDIIPKKISHCGAIAKKKHTQNIYNLDTIAAAGLRPILN
jgi:hypothetical protein